MHESPSFFGPTILLPDNFRGEEEGLAQSRQGAKEEVHEFRKLTLCAFAALREILSCLPEGIFRQVRPKTQDLKTQDQKI